ncbi:MAG: NAD-dependent malic enzyme [Dehalococcoidia bacterium]|nr:NAD-dependent malic enzyme [Dehalococcoidia bacterium]
MTRGTAALHGPGQTPGAQPGGQSSWDAHTIVIRISVPNRPGMLAKVASAIGATGGNIGAIDAPEITAEAIVRDISIAVSSQEHERQVVDAVRGIEGISVLSISNPILLAHRGGKIEITSKKPIKTRADLSTYYTPGVAEVSLAIHDDPQKAFTLTMKGNAVAVVTDGTAVLGLGDIGPAAALPVMEGKAMLFKELGGVDAIPICLATTDPDQIVNCVKYISPTFGGINLEDIAAPRCFEIEERLQRELDIPVFHDDQHGTAVVVMAALINALKITGKKLESAKIVISGVGAGGTSTAKLLTLAGARNIIGCDRAGALFRGRTEHMNPMKEWFVQSTNPEKLRGSLTDVLEGADVFIGLSAPRLLSAEAIARMGPDAIVFALANPEPEVMPEDATPYARIVATGRSDYANQINNVLCFPGMFRGALDCRAKGINDEMKLAAAHAIADVVSKRELHEDYIIPSVFDKRVAKNVAKAVIHAAHATGMARRRRKVSYEL